MWEQFRHQIRDSCQQLPTFSLHILYRMSSLPVPDNPVLQRDLSFASRNPTKDVIPSHVRPRSKLTDAQKVSADTKREINKENAHALQLEIDTFTEQHNVEIARLAKKFNKTEVKMKQLLTNVTKYQNTRLPSLRNALVHAKGVEMNEGM